MGFQPYSCGFNRLGGSGSVSDAGKPVLIYGYSVECAGTATSVVLFDGTTNTGAHFFKLGPIQTLNANVTSLPFPIMFPTGCYVSFDTNTIAVTMLYSLSSVTS